MTTLTIKLIIMEEKQITEKESLQLISEMIANSHKRLENSNGYPFLVWGYISLGMSLLVYFLLFKFQDYRIHYLWFLIPILGWSFMSLKKYGKKERPYSKTFITTMINTIWIVTGIATLLTAVGAFLIEIPVLQIIVLLLAMGVTLTGTAIKYPLITILGLVGMLWPIALFMVTGIEQILVFAAIFLIMMIIPGHILRYKNRKTHV